MTRSFETSGFAVIPDVVTDPTCGTITAAVVKHTNAGSHARMLLSEPWCRELAAALRSHPGLAGVVTPSSVAVQCTLFEQSPQKNWLVALHQDLSIPVKERVHDDTLSGWSIKDGTLFVQPPASVLETLVAVRLQLDDGGPATGALRVVPGSHRFGRLDTSRASALRDEFGEMTPAVERGGVLAMRPLLLHASSKATIPSSRRVLHFVFGPQSLPAGLAWASVV